MKKIVLSALAAAIAAGSMVATATSVDAQEWRRPPYAYRDTPPPRRHHDHGNRDAVIGGLAAGVIGGLIGGAIANNNGPRYIDPPPPPPPRCWFEDRQVPNAYDGGWHMESMRVCS